MFDRRIGILTLGVAGIAAYATFGGWGRKEVEFTRPAAPAPAAVDLRPQTSTAFLELPLDLDRIARRAEDAFKARIAAGLDGPDVCPRRPGQTDCAGPRLNGAITLKGRAEARVRGNLIVVRLPLTTDMAPTPAGAATPTANALKQPTDIAVSYAYLARPAASGGFDIARLDEAPIEPAASPAEARQIRLIEGRLLPVATAVQSELRQVFAALPIAAASQKAWAALSQPILLGHGTGAWMHATPDLVGAPEVSTNGARPVVRIPILTRLAIGEASAAPTSPRRPMIHGVIPAQPTVIRMAMPIGLDRTQQAADRTFRTSNAIETRPDRFGPPVKVAVHATRLYPSVRQLALELSLTATRFEGQSFTGKAHLVGRPVLDAATATVRLTDVTFPPAPPRETGSAKLPPGAPRLATEPFAAMLTAASTIDVSREIADAVPRAMNLLHHRIDDTLALSARLTGSAPVSIETSRLGLWVLMDLSGELSLTYEGPQAALAAIPRPFDQTATAARGTPRTTTPQSDLAAAAVVSAAAVAAARAGQPGIQTSPLQAAAVRPASVAVQSAPSTAADTAGEQTRQPPAAAASQRKRPVTKSAQNAKSSQSASASRQSWVPFANQQSN